MNLREPALARAPVEVVDVLGDQEAERAERLELGERVMAGVGLRYFEGPPQFIVLPLNPLLPTFFRVGQKALIAVHRRLAVFSPESARPAKGRNTALDRHPSPSQRNRIGRPQDRARRGE